MTKVLALGDVIGKPGRQCLDLCLAKAREKFQPDIVIANAENSAGGFGITSKVYEYLTGKLGIDVLTTGNHWHDKKEVHQFRDNAKKLLMPANMMNVDHLDMGLRIFETTARKPYAVLNLIGKVFMHQDNRNPFAAADALIARIPERVPMRFLDFHAEATSEKQALAHYLDGRVSFFFGTHTHTPTADERILTGGTGYLSDLGMNGAYDSVIGMKKEAALRRFLTNDRNIRLEPATQNLWFCFAVAEIDDQTGRCVSVMRDRWILNDMEL